MVKQNLRKLNRAELLELLIEQTNENERLREQLKETQNKLADKRLICENSGSLAEAALKLNGVFEAAEAACAQYTENIKRRYEENDRTDGEMISDTRETCNRMLAEAKAEADAYWANINAKVEALTAKSPTLKKLLSENTDQ